MRNLYILTHHAPTKEDKNHVIHVMVKKIVQRSNNRNLEITWMNVWIYLIQALHLDQFMFAHAVCKHGLKLLFIILKISNLQIRKKKKCLKNVKLGGHQLTILSGFVIHVEMLYLN